MYIDIGDGSIEENSGLRVCLNADEADKLKVARTISLTGDATGSASFDGAGDIEINVAIEKANSGLGEPIILTNEISYGNILPTNPEEGQLFFLGEDSEELSSLPKGGSAGQYLVKKSNEDGDAEWQTLNLPELNYLPLTGGTVTGDLTVTGNITGAKVYGAVWNDYAEYRDQKEEVKPGYCVASTNNGQVYKTTEKFQACDGIVSDTFGFAIGETDECKTPLAVAGRVLAYCEGDKYNYNAGDTVCAGPEGKIMKMTREQIQTYPDRIIGIVSEIPEYETWGTGDIAVDGRIWIKIK